MFNPLVLAALPSWLGAFNQLVKVTFWPVVLFSVSAFALQWWLESQQKRTKKIPQRNSPRRVKR
jgi:preprotein translocase subunit SecG